MRRLGWRWITSALFAVLLIALLVPLVACSSCSGAGVLLVMGSHPEAMGSEASTTGRLIDVTCPSCGGTARVSLYQKLTGEPPIVSRN